MDNAKHQTQHRQGFLIALWDTAVHFTDEQLGTTGPKAMIEVIICIQHDLQGREI